MKKLFYLLGVALLLISCNSKQSQKPLNLNVMSFNIRYDNPEDSLNNWQYRKDIAAQTIKEQNADVIGTQEVLVNQLNDLKSRLPEYTAIGVGRADGIEKGEFSAILYKKDRFNEIKSGHFWLSETPEVAGSRGWDGACERIATWAVLEDINTKTQFFFINTHLDHVGKVARQEGVTLLLDRAVSLGGGLPIIMTGDFNADPASDVIKHVTDASNPHHLIHSKDIAAEKNGTNWTFHGFGRVPEDKREFIDYIFVSPETKVFKHSVLNEKLNDQYISDHSVVVAQIEIQ
ncbi:endonuclease/exonuclease/phosphatase family protein [Dysgonomonas sp. Marseille-P4677]|uniref:endonuclease/exonuclease/phosphatase family protein n=1 Tax=Dysgonomonas sp. Marseille-P4677 TaxID=2364790 RepID=UPI0019138015|nr:endonuclease/exonuclease/phosphatase family protein [Dysgonomonas sp. Marseille-P4677]MBK5721209.1 endonuclease/exonuclease/phosphatase family protein [Dysgonomonas sp. Marseille-P4677]